MTTKITDKTQSLPWNLLLKYQLIEIILLWEGRLISKNLVDAFAIGRQQASKIIHQYEKLIAPESLYYDQHLKGFIPAQKFKPVFTSGTIDEYMHLLNGRNDLSSHTLTINPGQANTEIIFSPARFIVPEFIRPIICAARDGIRLEIQYMSLSSDNEEGRIITPHTLVYSGYRWHVRAHCEKHNDYRDFVLSRISDIPEMETPSEHGIEQDSAWNTDIVLRIIADPRLSPFQQKILMREYSMYNGILEIKTRAALASYYLHFLGINPKTQNSSAKAQQLVLENYAQIKQWLF